MSVANWKVIYRDYSSQELDTEEARLKIEAENVFLAQSVGGKSYQRSITSVEEKLRAISEIRREQSGNSYTEPTYVDFS
jgi:ribosomal protein L31E